MSNGALKCSTTSRRGSVSTRARQYTVLYTGMTNDMERRLAEHRAGLGEFSTRYKLSQLVYCEPTPDVNAAIAREKQLKGWTRAKNMALIEAANRDWRDDQASRRHESAGSDRRVPVQTRRPSAPLAGTNPDQPGTKSVAFSPKRPRYVE